MHGIVLDRVGCSQGNLYKLVRLGTQPGRPMDRKTRFVELAALVASELQRMTVTSQEELESHVVVVDGSGSPWVRTMKDDSRGGLQEKMWKFFAELPVEEEELGVLGEKGSFGKHLHLKGGAFGQIQLMQASSRQLNVDGRVGSESGR